MQQKYGEWTVLKVLHGSKLLVECSCGTIAERSRASIVHGTSKSCGCKGKEWCTTHSMEGTPTYYSWTAMKRRCKPGNEKYEYYSARGIKVCEKWMSFEGFLEDMGVKPEGTSLDRIDVNGNYCKENCRWVTSKRQMRNRRDNIKVEFEGKMQNVVDLAERFNINPITLKKRLRLGWTVEKSVNEPIRIYPKSGA